MITKVEAMGQQSQVDVEITNCFSNDSVMDVSVIEVIAHIGKIHKGKMILASMPDVFVSKKL